MNRRYRVASLILVGALVAVGGAVALRVLTTTTEPGEPLDEIGSVVVRDVVDPGEDR